MKGVRNQRLHTKLAFEVYNNAKICTRCFTIEGRICVHHKDENPGSNEESNLKILCQSCHNKHHKKGNQYGLGNKGNLGKIFTKEHLENLSKSHKGQGLGRKLSEETKNKIREKNLNRVFSGESRNYNKGKLVDGMGKTDWIKKTGKNKYQFYKLIKSNA